MKIGDVASGETQFYTVKNGFRLPWFDTHGYHNVTLEKVIPEFTNPAGLKFNDVIVIHSHQAFYKFLNWKWTGEKVWEVRRWHAPKVGVVQIDYYNHEAKTFGRHHAKSITKTPR